MSNPKSLCYFAVLEQEQLCFFDSDFIPQQGLTLNGSFAFIRYEHPDVMAIHSLIDHGSQHSGLDSFVQTLKQQLTTQRSRFFNRNHLPFFLPSQQPSYGGGIIFLKGDIVCWHLKSRSFSLTNPMCHDGNVHLEIIKRASGLPEARFITIEKADLFETYFMPVILTPEGQYPHNASEQDLADLICQIVQLPLMSQMPYNINAHRP